MAKKAKKVLTEQEQAPHASLVEVRNSIQVATDCSRKEAAEIANNLTAKQCDAVVAADGDKAKIATATAPAKAVVKKASEDKKDEKNSKK